MKTIYKRNLDLFDRYKEIFDKQGRIYETAIAGSVKKIITKDLTMVFFNRGNSDPSIAALCKSVSRDAYKWIEAHEDKKELKNQIVVFHNIPNCINNLKKKAIGYDISACYWSIAYRDGIISKSTWKKGLVEKEARLKALGNLNKTTFREKVVDGKKVQSIEENKNKPAWIHIISEVQEMYKDLMSKYPKDLLAWRTDCVYLTKEIDPKEVSEYFASKKLSVVQQEIELIEATKEYISHFNFKENKVKIWRDYKIGNYVVE